jgi:hypothetical protein
MVSTDRAVGVLGVNARIAQTYSLHEQVHVCDAIMLMEVE